MNPESLGGGLLLLGAFARATQTFNRGLGKGEEPEGRPLDSMGGALRDDFSREAREFDFAAEADVRAATKAIKIGRESKVSRIMTSFGVAPRTAETGQILRRMHPAPVKPVVKPAVRGVQLTTSAGACYERLMTEAGSITCLIDFSGFSSEALGHDRG